MTFPHSDFERYSLKSAAEKVVESYNQPPYTYAHNQETQKVRAEQKGVELNGAELAYVQEDIYEKMQTLKSSIAALERSLKPGAVDAAANRQEAERKLSKQTKELDFLEHNLAEKLFGEVKSVDSDTAVQ